MRWVDFRYRVDQYARPPPHNADRRPPARPAWIAPWRGVAHAGARRLLRGEDPAGARPALLWMPLGRGPANRQGQGEPAARLAGRHGQRGRERGRGGPRQEGGEPAAGGAEVRRVRDAPGGKTSRCGDRRLRDLDRHGGSRPARRAARDHRRADHRRRGGAEALVVSPPGPGVAARRRQARVGAERHRPVRARQTGGGGDRAGPRGCQGHARPQAVFRPHGPAAIARGTNVVSRRPLPGCLRETRRPAAGESAARRTVGPPLARRGAVWRERGLRVRR